jgi:hypothetical protein
MTASPLCMRLVALNAACLVSSSLKVAFGQPAGQSLVTGGR